jgi:hypothetical protein
MFKLTSLCYISIKVQHYKSRTWLTQSQNCQQFGHVWANCKSTPPPTAATTGNARKRARKIQHRFAAIVIKQMEKKPHPTNYGGCSHAKKEIRGKKIPRAPKTITGRVHHARRVLRGGSTKQGRPNSAKPSTAAAASVDQPRVQTPDQSVPAPNLNCLPQDNIIRAVTVVQQIMTEFNDVVSREADIQAITKIVLTLMDQNDQ